MQLLDGPYHLFPTDIESFAA